LSQFDTNAGDVTGYNPFRKEFDPPYDVAAEMMIADLEFFEDDPDDVRRAKVKLLHLSICTDGGGCIKKRNSG